MTAPRVSAVRKELDTIPGVVSQIVQILAPVVSPIGEKRMRVDKVPHAGWVARTRGIEGKSVADYPMIGVTLLSIDNVEGFRYNQQALFNGLPTRPQDGSEWRLKLQQARMTFGIMIQDDTEMRLQQIISRFLFRQRMVQTIVNVHGLHLPLKIMFDKGFTFPEMESAIDGNNFTMQTTVTANFFIGEAMQLPSVKSMDVNLLADGGVHDRKKADSFERIVFKRNSRGKFGAVEDSVNDYDSE